MGDPEGLGDAGKAALDKERSARKAADALAKAATDELEKLRAASKSDADKAIDEAKKAGASEVTQRLHPKIRRVAVKLALRDAGATPSLIEDLAGAQEFTALVVNDSDEVEGLDDAIKAHKARVPDAYKAPATPVVPGPSGSADGGVRGGGARPFTRDQLKKMTPAEINAEMEKPGYGGLAGLLKPGG